MPKDPVTGKELTRDQLRVVREKGTDPPFRNEFHDNHDRGMYRCVACGADLFSSEDKYESGSGWPSFTRPVARDALKAEKDLSHGMVRTEIVCAKCGAHQGHVFDDGPGPDGLRFCVNSSSLEFVPERSEGTDSLPERSDGTSTGRSEEE